MLLGSLYSCADPESFVRGGPTLITFFFLVDERRKDPNFTKRAIIGPPANTIKWRFAGVLMMAQHLMLAW